MAVQNMEAFRVSPNSIGIDLLRSQIKTALGIHVANVATVFRAGMVVDLNSSQEIIRSTGARVFGFAKYNKTNSIYATVVGEYIQLNGVLAIPLKHSPLLYPKGIAPGLGVRVATLPMAGVVYTEGAAADYTVDYTLGTITRVALGAINAGDWVYVNYAWKLGNDDFKYEGKNFWNDTDDVTIQNSRITVITDWATIFTTQFDPSETYAVNDSIVAGNTADGLEGILTKGVKGTAAVGRVMQIPIPNDPTLGVRFVGGMTS